MSGKFELFDTFPIKTKINKINSEMLSDSDGVKEGYSLVCDVDATHSGTLINNRVYPPDSMRKGIKSWTKPYKKPVLVNHDDTMDPVGRVIKAKYEQTPRAIRTMDYKPILNKSDGYGYQRLTLKVTDPKAINKILDGRYDTVSVRMTTNHAWCSVCNSDWSLEGPCDHMPGKKYDGELAYFVTGDLSYKEVSFVNIPADEFAGVKESLLVNESKDSVEPVSLDMYASNPEEKVLVSLGANDSKNLYGLLDSDATEEDDVVLHLIEESNKEQKDNKEEDVKLEELTKERLQELDKVKELIEDEVAKRVEDVKGEEQKSCEVRLAELTQDREEKYIPKEKYEEVIKELEDLKSSNSKKTEVKDEEGDVSLEDGDVEVKNSKETEDDKPDSDKDENDIEREMTDEREVRIKDLEKENQKLLDENVKINSERHKMIAEKLFDLKKTLNKPDVSGITTPDAKNSKVEEFSQRSIDSLNDQISDLMLEQETNNVELEGEVSNPGITQADKTNTVELSSSAAKVKESKKERLSRLFSKSSL